MLANHPRQFQLSLAVSELVRYSSYHVHVTIHHNLYQSLQSLQSLQFLQFLLVCLLFLVCPLIVLVLMMMMIMIMD
jgi:hypothetical protein